MSRVGAPACFALDLACRQLNEAFGGYGCYLVGSAMTSRDYNDVDVRLILSDDEFAALFPDASVYSWEQDARWLLLTTAISGYLRSVTGLPVDFQFQPQTKANERHDGKARHALGVVVSREHDPQEAHDGE